MKVVYDREKGMKVPLKMFTDGVPVEQSAENQLLNISRMPFIHGHIAVMPDVHLGKGATVGSVIPTLKAIIPAAVGVDIGCGMCAVKTNLRAEDLPDGLLQIRTAIEKAVPHGRTNDGGQHDSGAWGDIPGHVGNNWALLEEEFKIICAKHPKVEKANHVKHLGTLGTGNHFVEVCLDLQDNVWIMLHSGSRGVGNRIGSYFIQLAKEDMRKWHINLPDMDLAYMPEGTQYFRDYIQAVNWAQEYARINRDIMLEHTVNAIEKTLRRKILISGVEAINCHHNYVAKEKHNGQNVWITRKGAIRARTGDLGIIPGSMGARSFIVRGLGNRDSLQSCSHGAGRVMSRTAAKNTITLKQHKAALEGVECRNDGTTLDESPSAYKDIDAVMAAQSDLVEVVATLKQVLCVKG